MCRLAWLSATITLSIFCDGTNMIKGSIVAIVTPMHEDGSLDMPTLHQLLDWHIAEGTDGIVIVGTTGESPTLSHDEHNRVVDLCIEVAKGRVPVMAGTGSNSTDEAIMMTRHAKEAGADGALVVAPYYNKPTQEGIYQHYKTIHDAVEIPIVIYNSPGRSVIMISDETLARLAALPRIVGVKDATGDLARPYTLREKLKKPLSLLSGEDMTAVAFNASAVWVAYR
jgi:4-hydroxy-tetrahydrodipicolinate synthase